MICPPWEIGLKTCVYIGSGNLHTLVVFLGGVHDSKPVENDYMKVRVGVELEMNDIWWKVCGHSACGTCIGIIGVVWALCPWHTLPSNLEGGGGKNLRNIFAEGGGGGGSEIFILVRGLILLGEGEIM